MTTLKIPSPLTHRSRGFSLVEILAVLAVLSLIATASIPALTSISKGSDAAHATLNLAGFLEQARQYATANNTYVYVSFLEKAGTPQRELWVTASSSNGGVDISEQGTLPVEIGSSASQARQLASVLKLKGFLLKTSAEVPVASVPRPAPASDVNESPTPALGKIAGEDFPISFWFAPDGSANRVSEPLPTRLELAIQPEVKSDATWASVIQIAGLTGSVRVYRSE